MLLRFCAFNQGVYLAFLVLFDWLLSEQQICHWEMRLLEYSVPIGQSQYLCTPLSWRWHTSLRPVGVLCPCL